MVAAGRAQGRQIRLGVALVFTNQRGGKVDVVDQAAMRGRFQRQPAFALLPAQRVDDGQCDIVERLCPAGPQVENA